MPGPVAASAPTPSGQLLCTDTETQSPTLSGRWLRFGFSGKQECTFTGLSNVLRVPMLPLLPLLPILTAAISSPQPPPTVQQERDQLYTWLAYAVVYRDWQTTAQRDSSRGFNIGSVLVNADGYVVNWGRNCVNRTANQTQHGEVRLIQSFLGRTRQRALSGYTIYTTLEPCAMCSGMMTLTQVTRTVFGQRDPDYGDALQRLQLDSRACARGYGPYPRAVQVSQATDVVSAAIDSAYARHRQQRIVDFLARPATRTLYARAAARLARFTPRHPENQSRLDSARRFLARLPQEE